MSASHFLVAPGAGTGPRHIELRQTPRTNGGRFARVDEGLTLHFTADEQEIFSKGVEAFTHPQAAALADGYDFGRHDRIMDVGGGTSSFLRAIRTRHPLFRRLRAAGAPGARFLLLDVWTNAEHTEPQLAALGGRVPGRQRKRRCVQRG